MATHLISGLAYALLFLSPRVSATIDGSDGEPKQPQRIDSLEQTSQWTFDTSFREPLFRVPSAMGPASARAGRMSANSYAGIFRRDTCDDNCKTLSDGATGKCCHTSDGGGWCCGENDDCGPGDGNYCGGKKNSCSDLGSCSSLAGGGQGRCCTGADVNGGSWCCGEENTCGDGVDSNYCTWAMATTTVVETGTVTETVTNVATVTDATWITVTSTSITWATVSSADIATEYSFVTQNALARLGRGLVVPEATPAAVSTALYPRQDSKPGNSPVTKDPWQRRDFITSTVTTTSTSYETQTDTDQATTTVNSVTSTTTSILVTTLTTVLNARTTTTITSTIIQPAGASSSSGSSNPPSFEVSGSKGDGSDKGLSTGAKAGIGAGSAVGVLAVLAIAFLLWRRQREKKNQEKVKQYIPPDTTQYAPVSGLMTDDGPAKYASTAPQMPQELGGGPANYANVAPHMPQELESGPVSQQLYPRSVSPQGSTGNPVEMYSAPAEVSGSQPSRPQELGSMGGSNQPHVHMDEWRR